MSRLGHLAGTLHVAPLIIGLTGSVGSGKSVFARAFVRAACRDPLLDVPSPSFVLDYEYSTRGGILVHHMDMYALRADQSVPGVTADITTFWSHLRASTALIEWPDNLPSTVWPPPPGLEYMTVAMELPAAWHDDTRSVRITPHGATCIQFTTALRAAYERWSVTPPAP